MNFTQLQARLATRLGGSTSVTDTATRYKNALNEVHRQTLRMHGLEKLRQGTVTFASVASQKLYALPEQGVARINRITEATNDRKLEYRTSGWLDEVAPDPTTGTPWAWIERGYSHGVHTQPSDASEVFAKSTSAADTTQTIHVEGIITGGYYRTASVQLTGATAVSLSASITSFIQITKVYLTAVAAGVVTLHEDSGAGTELSRIAIGDVAPKFIAFQLYNTPSAVLTYTADVLRAIPDMANDTDEPLIPEDFHDLLLDKAERKELRKKDDPARHAMLATDITRGERELISFVVNHPDWRPQWNDGMGTGISTLGAWYPADTRVG
jgi:hypothetical protein